MAFFVIYKSQYPAVLSIFLPAAQPFESIAQGGPFQGLVAKSKIILASLRYFLLPSLAESPTKDSPASKKTKIRLHGADHVKL